MPNLFAQAYESFTYNNREQRKIFERVPLDSFLARKLENIRGERAKLQQQFRQFTRDCRETRPCHQRPYYLHQRDPFKRNANRNNPFGKYKKFSHSQVSKRRSTYLYDPPPTIHNELIPSHHRTANASPQMSPARRTRAKHIRKQPAPLVYRAYSARTLSPER